jgi:hypothetical protein
MGERPQGSSEQVLPLVTFNRDEVSALLPDSIASALFEVGVPRDFLGIYKADGTLTQIEFDGRDFLRFGTRAGRNPICVDIANGQVVELVVTRGPQSQESANVAPFNNSIQQFTATAVAFVRLEPYYTTETWEQLFVAGEIDHLLNMLLSVLKEIDMEDSMWYEIAYDIHMGDYPSESTVNVERGDSATHE